VSFTSTFTKRGQRGRQAGQTGTILDYGIHNDHNRLRRTAIDFGPRRFATNFNFPGTADAIWKPSYALPPLLGNLFCNVHLLGR
jgi:hypothetical protein